MNDSSLYPIHCYKFDSERGSIIEGIIFPQDNITLFTVTPESWSFFIHNAALSHKSGKKNLYGAPFEFPSGGTNRVMLEMDKSLICAFFKSNVFEEFTYQSVFWRDLCMLRQEPKIDVMAPLDKTYRVHPQGRMYLLLDAEQWTTEDTLILSFYSEYKIKDAFGRGKKSIRGKYRQRKLFRVFHVTEVMYEIFRTQSINGSPELTFQRTVGKQFQRSKVLKSLS